MTLFRKPVQLSDETLFTEPYSYQMMLFRKPVQLSDDAVQETCTVIRCCSGNLYSYQMMLFRKPVQLSDEAVQKTCAVIRWRCSGNLYSYQMTLFTLESLCHKGLYYAALNAHHFKPASPWHLCSGTADYAIFRMIVFLDSLNTARMQKWLACMQILILLFCTVIVDL